MSEKQLGAAPGEEVEPVAGKRVGWFGRLRAQPGFRTASVAFVLTVVLGIGSTAAYAYWSQKQDLTISGTTVGPVLSVPERPTCELRWGYNRVSWLPIRDSDPEARYIVTFQVGKKSVSYAVPPDVDYVQPVTLSALRDTFGATGWDRWDMAVTLETAIVAAPKNYLVQITDKADKKQVVHLSKPSGPRSMFYAASGLSYPCY